MVVGAVAGGVLAAVPTGWLASRLARAARNMRTDATPTRADLVGALGVVVTPIPADGYGEVRIRLGGQPVKLNARADQPSRSAPRSSWSRRPATPACMVEETY